MEKKWNQPAFYKQQNISREKKIQSAYTRSSCFFFSFYVNFGDTYHQKLQRIERPNTSYLYEIRMTSLPTIYKIALTIKAPVKNASNIFSHFTAVLRMF